MSDYSSPSPVEATGVVNADFGINRSNWDTAEFLGLSFMQTERILPSLRIHAGPDTWALEHAPAQLDFERLTMPDPLTGEVWTLNQILERRIFNNGILVLQQGRILHESYRNGMKAETRHLGQSTTKSFIAMLVGIAIGQGKLSPDEPISSVVSELDGKPAWSSITLQHVLDMTAGIRFTEDYTDRESDVWVMCRAMGWLPRRPDDPAGTRGWVAANLNESEHPPGKVFSYASVMTQLLGLALEHVYQEPLGDLFGRLLFSTIGAEADAAFGTDGTGLPIGDGALMLRLRDFGRGASLALNKGRNHRGEQVVPETFFDDMLTPHPDLQTIYSTAYPRAPAGSQYRSQFWVRSPERGKFGMSGIHGQTAHMDCENDLLVVTYGAYPIASSELLTASINGLVERLTIELGGRY